ncbi:hypothetical protein NZNM25_19610 [Nitrosopumilus zosterae]|uniref:Glycosyltransferase RgtA/B/C/D-like domain-containing protein n=1 Tax=Nitrosopumilus zosterae TaxID=718286 RepID=A0A2S2KU26_9ARCH|nr:glycosyltransferase family 39 protein [Nitrosopumilus zosterae]BDQ31820.1 glycosyltransferase family 39 protein [Nitrosopumilus zosterae]GBH35170.1 hypothetical protein NZNM25_19610 [Nitrosopumilus zosterae]
MMSLKLIKNDIKISFLTIFLAGLGIKLFYFPYDLPLIIDGMDNFTYATAINFYGHLPTEWTPINNGWPIFVSFWFSIFDLENSLQYMQLQRIISVILSSMITIPVYYLCKNYFNKKIALVGAAIISFDPRIILNSFLGITEPLFILLGISSLVIFLKYERKLMFISFILASFCTIVRSEGLFLFFTLTILFFIKNKISKEILRTYLPCLLIFMMILIPVINYRIEVVGYDGIFQRAIIGTDQIIAISNSDKNSEIIDGIGLFIKYLGWIMIPNFLLFFPFGVIQYFRNRTKETNFIMIFSIVCSIPIMYAYIVQAQDTRYLYFLFPIFSLVSLYSVKTFISKIANKNTALVVIIIGIFISSIGFYEFLKTDREIERENYEISKIISEKVSGVNFHPSQTQYIRVGELPTKWPFDFNDDKHKIKIISTNNENDLEEYILKNDSELTHLIVDENSKLPKFLQDVYYNEEKFKYLDKVFDSKDFNFNQHLKLFEINFENFNSKINQEELSQ